MLYHILDGNTFGRILLQHPPQQVPCLLSQIGIASEIVVNVALLVLLDDLFNF